MSSYDGRRYPSDLTDDQWKLLEPMVPKPSPEGRPIIHERRAIVNGILYVLRSGCPWRLCRWISRPGRLSTTPSADGKAKGSGIRCCLPFGCRCAPNKAAILIPVLPLSIANPSKLVRFGVLKRATIPEKKGWGRKRHVLVDTEGNLLAIKVTGANLSDQQGAKLLLAALTESFPRIKLMWGDTHYGGTFVSWLQAQLDWKMQTVQKAKIPARGLLAAEDEEPDWEARFPSGFVPLPRRWVVERTFAWISRWRRLCRDHEGLPQTSEAFITLAMSRRMLTKLALFSP